MKIIDCTFCDGGYYKNWNFPEQLINDYLSNPTASAAGLSRVERAQLSSEWANPSAGIKFAGPVMTCDKIIAVINACNSFN